MAGQPRNRWIGKEAGHADAFAGPVRNAVYDPDCHQTVTAKLGEACVAVTDGVCENLGKDIGNQFLGRGGGRGICAAVKGQRT